VAGEHSTTEPPMLVFRHLKLHLSQKARYVPFLFWNVAA
jgi:hypothetical protein